MLQWHKLFKKYVRFNAEMRKHIELKRKELFCEGEKILGVSLRGTDYINLHPYGHPVQPDLPTALATCKKIFKEQSCDKIFLATEDKGINEAFLADTELKDKIITLSRNTLIPDTGKEYIVSTIKDDQAVITATAQDYLTELALLSKCNCFLAGQTSGNIIVAVMTDGFEYAHYFDFGRYGIDEKPMSV